MNTFKSETEGDTCMHVCLGIFVFLELEQHESYYVDAVGSFEGVLAKKIDSKLKRLVAVAQRRSISSQTIFNIDSIFIFLHFQQL